MKHLRDSEIQAFIDGELSPRQVNRVERHLQQCPACTARVEEQRAKIDKVFSVLNLVNNPEIKHPHLPLHHTKASVETLSVLSPNRKKWFGNIASVAAVAILVLSLTFIIRQNTLKEEMLGKQIFVRYEMEDEFDANRPITEQDYVFRVYQQ
jgi:anti-sigma factor RsiW